MTGLFGTSNPLAWMPIVMDGSEQQKKNLPFSRIRLKRPGLLDGTLLPRPSQNHP